MTEVEEIAILKTQSETHSKNISEIWKHINTLDSFKSNLEGGMSTIKWMLGFVGVSNIILTLKLFIK